MTVSAVSLSVTPCAAGNITLLSYWGPTINNSPCSYVGVSCATDRSGTFTINLNGQTVSGLPTEPLVLLPEPFALLSRSCARRKCVSQLGKPDKLPDVPPSPEPEPERFGWNPPVRVGRQLQGAAGLGPEPECPELFAAKRLGSGWPGQQPHSARPGSQRPLGARFNPAASRCCVLPFQADMCCCWCRDRCRQVGAASRASATSPCWT